MIPISEAARRTGKAIPTIRKAIKTGRLSAMKDESGDWRIDPAELFRVYPVSVTGNGQEGEGSPAGNAVHLAEIEALRRENALLREQLDDTRQDRDQWRQQATALLTDQRPRQSEPALETPQKPVQGRLGRAWEILRGKG